MYEYTRVRHIYYKDYYFALLTKSDRRNNSLSSNKFRIFPEEDESLNLEVKFEKNFPDFQQNFMRILHFQG